ncbi:hypothetical protein [Shigella sp. FC1967]
MSFIRILLNQEHLFFFEIWKDQNAIDKHNETGTYESVC